VAVAIEALFRQLLDGDSDDCHSEGYERVEDDNSSVSLNFRTA
jgi:hypothetical protein